MTPQTHLTLSKVFENKEIRAIEYKGEVWIPIVDIAEAWGLDRSNVTKIIKRNAEVFAGLSTVVDIMSPNTLPSDIIGNSLKCVNEQGVYVLALKVSAGRIKDKEVKKTIIRFQKWVPELIQQFRKGELVSPTQLQKPVDILNRELDLADLLIKRSGMPKEIAHSMAIVLAGDKAGMDLHCYSTYLKAQTTQLQLPAASHEDIVNYDKHFSITKVAAALKLPIDKVRNVLESLNIIYFENGIWKLTAHGEQYGKMFMVTPGYPYRTTQKAYIKYNPLLIDLLKKYFDVQVPVTKVE
jgi:prophage antirepressor-like protein